MVKKECIEWDKMGKCLDWRIKEDGTLMAEFKKSCPIETKKLIKERLLTSTGLEIIDTVQVRKEEKSTKEP